MVICYLLFVVLVHNKATLYVYELCTGPDGTLIKWRMRGATAYTKPTQGCFGAKWGSICMYRSVMFHTWGGEGDGGGIHGHFVRGHFFTDKMSVKGSRPTTI